MLQKVEEFSEVIRERGEFCMHELPAEYQRNLQSYLRSNILYLRLYIL